MRACRSPAERESLPGASSSVLLLPLRKGPGGQRTSVEGVTGRLLILTALRSTRVRTRRPIRFAVPLWSALAASLLLFAAMAWVHFHNIAGASSNHACESPCASVIRLMRAPGPFRLKEGCGDCE